MLDKIGRIITPLMIGFGIGYTERNYSWNKAWDKQVENVNKVLKDIIIE